MVRRSIVDHKTIRARERIKSANMEATEPKKLCNRTKSALSYLLSCRYVSTIYDALKDLGKDFSVVSILNIVLVIVHFRNVAAVWTWQLLVCAVDFSFCVYF